MEIYLLTIFPLLCLPPALPLLTPPWPGPYWDIPGSYCQSSFPQGECCPGRKDRCSVPILGTLCYCDTFCNRYDIHFATVTLSVTGMIYTLLL